MTLIPQHIVLQSPSNNDPLLDLNTQPNLDLQFATNKTLNDNVSGNNLITFSRASTGTYVDSAGFIKNSVVNQFPFSDFSNNAWATSSANIIKRSTNNPAPDGTNTAVLIGSATTSDFLVESLDATGNGLQTFTFYAKGTATGQSAWIAYFDGGANRGQGSISLDDGSVSNVFIQGDAALSATNAGDGWWRCQLTLTPAGTSTFNWRASTYDGSDIYVWGAQLEEGSTATSYIPTTNTISGAPRFDHDPVTLQSLGLLIEEERTNQHLYSNDSGFYNFTTTADTIKTTAFGTDPFGVSAQTTRFQTGNVFKVIRTTSNGGIDATLTPYCISFYYRGDLPPNVTARVGPAQAPVILFPPIDGKMGRAYVALTSGSFASVSIIDFSVPPNFDMELWGVQVEKNKSFPSSYIPTTTAAVTRKADEVSITGTNFSSWYNQSKGTVFSDFISNYGEGSNTTVGSINDGGSSQRISLRPRNTIYGGAAVASLGVNETPPNVSNKIAWSFDTSGLSLISGSASDLYNSALASQTLTQLDIGMYEGAGPANRISGTISRLTYYPYRLPDTTLQEITS